MPHPTLPVWKAVAGIGVVPGAILGGAILAQEAIQPQGADYTNIGAVAAVIAMLAFLLTKYLPKVNTDNNQTQRQMNEEHNKTIRHMSDNKKQALESQRKDILDFVKHFKNEEPDDG